MKKLAISVVLGSLLFSGSAMSTENYKPREFWENKEVVQRTVEKAFNIAQSKLKGTLFEDSDGDDGFLASELTRSIYQSVTNFMKQNCLEALSMDEFLISLDLYAPNGEWIPMEKIWDFLDHVGNILGRELY